MVAIAVLVLWWRLRSRHKPHAFLRALGLWGRGLPMEMILEAEELARRSGTEIPLRSLVAAYERHRDTVRNAQELLLAARTDGESASPAEASR